jgi:hypothetical protein
MKKVAISCAIGVVAGLALAGAYFAAPYAGVSVAPATLMIAAAIVAFGSSVAILTLSALSKPEKKQDKKPTKRLSELADEDYAHFPTTGVRIVLRPDSSIEELDVVRHPSAYVKSNIFLTVKKSSGKSVHNPILLKRLFLALKDFELFLHIVLMNEHDEYVGYIPAAYARAWLVGDNAESLIRKYFVDVLADPKASSGKLIEIGGLSKDETIADSERIGDALKKVSDGLLRGLVVFKDKRNRKPIGVIYSEDLVKLNMTLGG